MRKIISKVLLVGTFLVIYCMFFFSNFFTKGNYHPYSVIAPKQNSTFYFPHTHFQSSNYFHYEYNTDYPINQSVNSSSYGLLTQNTSQSKIHLLQTRHPNSMQALNLYSKENTSMSTGPSTKATAFQSQSFTAFSSSEPFSSSSTSSGTFSGPQYTFPDPGDETPVPLGNEIIPLALLISSFVLYKFIKH